MYSRSKFCPQKTPILVIVRSELFLELAPCLWISERCVLVNTYFDNYYREKSFGHIKKQ